MIPIKWADTTLSAMTYLRSRQSFAGVTFTRTKRDGVLKQVVIDTEPMQLETPITRRVSLLLECWVYNAQGNTVPSESYDLLSQVLYELQSAPRHLQQVVRFDQPAGPRSEKDAATAEYHEGSIVWVVSR